MDKIIEILKSCVKFKHNVYYWYHDVLTHEENQQRNYPAPWIAKTIELLKIIEGNTIVEIGSTRREATQRCLDYYDNSYKMLPAQAPPCCQDGHSTCFWADAGFET